MPGTHSISYHGDGDQNEQNALLKEEKKAW